MHILNMGGLKIISILLIHHFISPSFSSDPSPPVTQTARPRLDIYDEILRPPPPPPNLAALRGQFQNNNGLRHQRQNNQLRPQSASNQGSYGPPQYGHDRYPTITSRPTQSPSFFQKVSSWLFTPDNEGPNNDYGPPPTYGAPPLNGPHLNANPSHGPSSNGHPSHGPPSNGHPSYGPPLNGPNVNAPPSHGPPVRFQQAPNKKICSTCNQFPWIPVLRYQTAQKSLRPTGDHFNFNANSPHPGPVLNNGGHNSGPPQKSPFEPAKLALPNIESNNRYLPQKFNNNEQAPGKLPSPPTTYAGKPFSLADQSLDVVSPTSNNYNKPIVTNSYGTPIPPSSYGSPLPETNDGGDPHFVAKEPNSSNNIRDQHHESEDDINGNPSSIKDTYEHLETNNVPSISNLNDEKSPQGFTKNTSSSGNNEYIPKPESIAEHNDDPFSHFPVANRYEQNRGIQILQPIPLPNLSPIHIPPIFNARPFRTQYANNNNYQNAFSTQESTVLPSKRPSTNSYSTPYSTNAHSYNEYSSPQSDGIKTFGSTSRPNLQNPNPNGNFQLLPSVPIAEFTSSIEYPISIIQSPLLEIETSPENNHENGHGASHINENINLKKHPIVVQNENPKRTPDSHSAASGGNFHNTQDVEDTITGNQFHFLPTPNSIDVDPTEKTQHQSISYSYIDQTFTNGHGPSSTPIPVNHKSEFSKFEDQPPVQNIFNSAQPSTLQSLDSPLLYLNPNVPHKDSKLFSKPTYSTSSPKDSLTTLPIINDFSSVNSPTQRPPAPTSWSSDFRNIERDEFVPGRWPPPATDVHIQPFENATKKPKRIQIIIPYTSKNSPSPFKFSNKHAASTSGWLPMSEDYLENHGRKVPPSITETYSTNGLHLTNSDIDYHQSSESKIVSSSAPSMNSTKIFYNVTYQKPEIITENKTKNANKLAFDIKKLQQNIDEWTAQEYSKIYKRQQKASTITHLKRSKNIPEEYLTTTPSQKRPPKTFLSSINDLNASLLDNEAAGSIQHSVEKDLHSETTEESIRDGIYELNEILQNTKKPYLTTKRLSKTTVFIETTTLPPRTTTKHSWEKIQTSISPLTKEKVYVVTPLPWNTIDSSSIRNRIVSTTSPSTSKLKEEFGTLSFKSPRFLVRPTPGPTGSQKEISFSISDDKRPNEKKSGLEWLRSINNLEETTTESWESRNEFGLSAVTSYKPPDGSSVHTSAGHSKVATVVTPSTSAASTSQ